MDTSPPSNHPHLLLQPDLDDSRRITHPYLPLERDLDAWSPAKRIVIISAQSFVGSNSVNWLWTNGDDIAFCEGKYVDASEIEDCPHPNCRIEYDVISSEYNGDAIAWLNNIEPTERPSNRCANAATCGKGRKTIAKCDINQ